MISWIRALKIDPRIAALEMTDRRLEVLLVAGILLVTVLLRFYRLGDWSLWIDELYTLIRIQAHYIDLQAVMRNVPPQHLWINVSLLLTSGLINAFGVSAWTLRLAPALIGIVTVPVLYVLVKRIFDRPTALIAALLLAISPWHLTWSQNARFYTAVMLFCLLALGAIYLGLERDRPLYTLSGLFFYYLALSERIFAMFFAPVIAAYVLLLWLLPFEKPRGLNRRNLAILALPIIAGVLIEGWSLWTAGVSRFFGDFYWFFAHRNYSAPRLLAAIIFSVSPVLMITALFGGGYLARQRSRAGLLFLLAAIIPVIFLLGASLVMFTKDRYVFITLPAWITLAAVAARAAWERLGGRNVFLGAVLLAILVTDAAEGNLLYFKTYDGNRLDWESAFGVVREFAEEDDAIVTFWPELGEFYLERDVLALTDVAMGDVVEMNRRVWFVIDSETIKGFPIMEMWIEDNAQLVEALYLRTPTEQYLRIYVYDPAQAPRARE